MIHLLFVQDDLLIGECTKYMLEEEYGYKVTWLQPHESPQIKWQKKHQTRSDVGLTNY